MDEKEFFQQFDALIDKYAELLIGDSSETAKEKIKAWALYNHIAKTMPALTKHWNGLYPEAKGEMKKIIDEIRQLNEQHREKK